MSEKSTKKVLRLGYAKIRDIVLLSVLAILLIFAVYKIFYNDTTYKISETVSLSNNNELSLKKLLSEIDGVGDVDVMILEEENDVKSVIIVCDGANNIRVNLIVLEATSTALNVDRNNIKIYLKKN